MMLKLTGAVAEQSGGSNNASSAVGASGGAENNGADHGASGGADQPGLYK